MTQAGAAQNAPATLPGRIVAIGWMIASIIVIAVFTAGITSTLTKRELQGMVHDMNDLRSARVGAPAGSAPADYLDHQRISYRGFGGPQEGLKALQAGTIDAFVYDKPLLTWLVLRDFFEHAADARHHVRQSELRDRVAQRQSSARRHQLATSRGNRERLVAANTLSVFGQDEGESRIFRMIASSGCCRAEPYLLKKSRVMYGRPAGRARLFIVRRRCADVGAGSRSPYTARLA